MNRWCPWWLSVDDFAPEGMFNTVCRPLAHSEFLTLPGDLQPLMKHLCPDEQDTLQQPVLDRAQEAELRNQAGIRQLEEETPDEFAKANKKPVPILVSFLRLSLFSFPKRSTRPSRVS